MWLYLGPFEDLACICYVSSDLRLHFQAPLATMVTCDIKRGFETPDVTYLLQKELSGAFRSFNMARSYVVIGLQTGGEMTLFFNYTSYYVSPSFVGPPQQPTRQPL
jgi:hypothetical protein